MLGGGGGEHIGVNLALGSIKGTLRDGVNSVRSVPIPDRAKGRGGRVCTQAELRCRAWPVRRPFDQSMVLFQLLQATCGSEQECDMYRLPCIP